jgi:hypothetical protein
MNSKMIYLCEPIELPLGLLGGLPQALHGQAVLAQVQARVLAELLQQVLYNTKSNTAT